MWYKGGQRENIFLSSLSLHSLLCLPRTSLLTCSIATHCSFQLCLAHMLPPSVDLHVLPSSFGSIHASLLLGKSYVSPSSFTILTHHHFAELPASTNSTSYSAIDWPMVLHFAFSDMRGPASTSKFDIIGSVPPLGES